jgi:hypothetical protein
MAARPLSDSLARVDRLLVDVQQLRPVADESVLASFVKQSVSWDAEPVPVPPRLRRGLWAMLSVQTVWGGWLSLTALGSAPWGSWPWDVATLGHHGLLLACSAACFVGLVTLALFTHGFVRANAREAIGLVTATAAGGMALAGLAALALLILVAVVVVVVFVLTFTFTP